MAGMEGNTIWITDDSKPCINVRQAGLRVNSSAYMVTQRPYWRFKWPGYNRLAMLDYRDGISAFQNKYLSLWDTARDFVEGPSGAFQGQGQGSEANKPSLRIRKC